MGAPPTHKILGTINEEQPAVNKPKKGFDRLEEKIRSWSDTSSLVQKPVSFYKQHQRFVPAAFFFGGVAWDGATLRRIDSWVDSAILLAYILALGLLVIVALFVEKGRVAKPFVLKYKTWYPAAIQFLLGALFSAYFIFYLQSTSLRSESIIFIGVLVLLLVANEFLHSRLLNPYLLFALYYLACVSFFIFFIPVVTKQLGYGVFLSSCLIGLVITGGLLYIVKKKQLFSTQKPVTWIAGIVLGLFALLNVFYVNNWIPPVPLSMKEGDIYRGLERDGDQFVLRYATPDWYQFWVDSDRDFKYAEGDTVYCFAAVFAPTKLETSIYHSWHYLDEEEDDWVRTDSIGVEIEGGRQTGFRTYTRKRFMQPGKWRVDVQVADGRVLGRIPFTVSAVDSAITQFEYRRYD